MAPKKDSISLLRNLFKMFRDANEGERTTSQIQCPGVINMPPVGPATKDKELGTDQSHGMATGRPWTIDHDASPLS